MPRLQLTRFTLDGLIAPPGVEGFTRGERWNGFACPCFTKPQAERLLAMLDAAYEALLLEFEWRWEGDTLVVSDDVEESPYRWSPVSIEGCTYWPIGARSWAWSEVGDFD